MADPRRLVKGRLIDHAGAAAQRFHSSCSSFFPGETRRDLNNLEGLLVAQLTQVLLLVFHTQLLEQLNTQIMKVRPADLARLFRLVECSQVVAGQKVRNVACREHVSEERGPDQF